MIKYKVLLTKRQRTELLQITKGGQHSSKRIIHALILLNCDEGTPKGTVTVKVKNEDVARVLKIGMRTIDRIKKKFAEEGFEVALEGKPETKIYQTETRVKDRLIKLSSTKVPEGLSRWSFRLLAKKMVELKYVDNISHETVRNILKGEKKFRKQ